MKSVVVLMVSMFFCSMSIANSFTRTAEVEFIRTHNSTSHGDDNDWVALKDISSIGSCRTSGNLVVLRLTKDMERAYSTILAAQLAGKKVVVNVDDSFKDSTGACWVRWVNVQN